MNQEPSAVEFHFRFAGSIQFVIQDTCHNRCTGAGTTGQRNRRAPFPDTHAHMLTVFDLNELRIRLAREKFMGLKLASEFINREVFRIIDKIKRLERKLVIA